MSLFKDPTPDGFTKATADLLRMSNADIRIAVGALVSITDSEEDKEEMADFITHLLLCLGGSYIRLQTQEVVQ